jgi:hypothetical protein
MAHSIVEDGVANSPHHILPTVQEGADYHTIHSIRKSLRANARSIESHLGNGTLGNLGITVSITACATIAPAHSWVNPESQGGAPNEIFGNTVDVLLAECHCWEESVIIFRTWTTMEQALKKQISKAFEPMYLKILKNDIVGFTNTTARDMLGHLFISYGSITAVDLEQK